MNSHPNDMQRGSARIKGSCVLSVTALFSLCAVAQRSQPLADLVSSANAIVITDFIAVSAVGTRVKGTFKVIRTLKGRLAPDSLITAHYTASDNRTYQIPPNERAMLFLREESPGVWGIISLDSQGGGLRSAYFVASPSAPSEVLSYPGNSVVDDVVREMAAAVESRGDLRSAEQLASRVSGNDSPIALEIYRQWANGLSGPLRTLGLRGLISSGDPAAVVRLASEHEILAGTPLGVFAASTLYGFRKQQADAVRALGELATSASLAKEIKSAALSALRAIHCRDAVPFFYMLLENPDAYTRAIAVGGFSAFVTNMRAAEIGMDEAEAMDEVLNPGRRRRLPSLEAPYETNETRRYLHFGRFRNATEETDYLAFWKAWYQANRSKLGL